MMSETWRDILKVVEPILGEEGVLLVDDATEHAGDYDDEYGRGPSELFYELVLDAVLDANRQADPAAALRTALKDCAENWEDLHATTADYCQRCKHWPPCSCDVPPRW